MTTKTLLLALVAGSFFSSYPFLIRMSGLNYVAAAIALQIGTMIVFAPLSPWYIDLRAIIVFSTLLALVAGVMNGFWHMAFQRLLATPDVEISRLTVVMVAVQIVVAMAIGNIFNGERITPIKCLGALFVGLGIWLVKT